MLWAAGTDSLGEEDEFRRLEGVPQNYYPVSSLTRGSIVFSSRCIMSKKDLLIRLAIDAVNWGEGADFEMKELIEEFSPSKAIKEHYGDQFPLVFNYNEDEEDEEDDDEDEEEKQREKFYEVIGSDIVKTLESLLDEPR
jgi:hypothetical protein